MSVSCDLLLTNATVLTMDDAVHGASHRARSRSAATRSSRSGRRARRTSAAETHRLPRPRRDAGPGQRAHPRADDAAARAGRRSAPRRLADGLHDAGRARVRQPRLRRARHAARLRRDDPLGHRPASPTCTTSRRRSPRRPPTAGMRALCAQTVLRFPTPDAASFEDSLARAREFIAALAGPSADRARRRRRTRPTPARRRSCAPAPSWPSSSTCRCTPTWRRPRSRWSESRREHGMPVVPWVKKQRLFDAQGAGRALRARRRGRDARAEERRRRRRAQPDQQPEARRRRRAGRADAGARRRRRHRHRRPGVEQRPRHVRGDAAGGAARQGHRRRSDGAAGARRRWRWRRGIGARAMHIGRPHRIARGRQARRPDRASISIGSTTCPRFGRDPDGDLRADRLRREVHRRRRRDVQRPLADARPPAADARRRRSCARRRATWRARIDAFLVEPRGQRAAEAGRDRRRRRAGELRSAGQGARRVRRTRCWRRSAATRSPSSDRATTTSTTPTGRSTIRTRDGCATARTSSSTRQGTVTGARARLTLTGPSREDGVRRGAAVPLALLRAGGALAALLPRVFPAGAPSARSRRIGAAGWSPTAASSSTCTSIGC